MKIQTGLTVASGYPGLVSTVLEKITDLFHQESQTILGEAAEEGRPVEASLLLGPLFWIDSGNSFDPYYLARAAARKGLDPKRALRAVQVARPFTAYQLQRMLGNVPSASSLSFSGTVCRRPLVIISDLMGLFYDPEIQEDDRRRAHDNFVGELGALKKRAVVLALLMPHVVSPAERALLQPVLQLADSFASHPDTLPIPLKRSFPKPSPVEMSFSQPRELAAAVGW